jgi:hypothetical protein
MKYDFREFYIGGEWAPPSCSNDYYVINPATEEVVGVISLGSTDDAARAVAAAKAAFPEYSQTTPTERSALMARIFEGLQSELRGSRRGDLRGDRRADHDVERSAGRDRCGSYRHDAQRLEALSL